MPTYEYSCRDCGHQFETRQSIADDPLNMCPACGGVLRKVFAPVGIAFKGEGFYKTDSRSNSKASEKKRPSESTEKDSKATPESSDTGSSDSGSSGSSSSESSSSSD